MNDTEDKGHDAMMQRNLKQTLLTGWYSLYNGRLNAPKMIDNLKLDIIQNYFKIFRI